MTRRSISNSFTVNTVEDGESAPFYNDEWYAWSNDESTASVTTAPTIAGEWSHTIPSQGSYAYLWKKVVRYDWQNNTRTYVEGAAQYFRMSGTNGTSINVKGTIEYAYNSRSGFPTPSSSITGYRAVAKEDNRIWICQQVAQDAYDWVPYGGTASDGFSYTIVQGNFNGNYQSTSNLTGHLVMWSDEASDWVDLGRFKGEDGVTYYTHIAWATSVGYDNQGNVTRVTGFVTVKLASDTTHIWMGVLIDTNAGQDSSNKLLYTWSNTKGNKGDKGDEGARGKVGRFFYYAGVWNNIASTDSFVVSDAQAPYFQYGGTSAVPNYWVFNPSSNGTYTKEQMGTPSSSSANWEQMTNDFKYIITEALFGSYAHLGSWIFNGDYMISEKDKDGNPRGQREYNGMGDSQLTGGFVPSVALDASNGRASFSGDKVRFNPSGSGWLANKNINWTNSGELSLQGKITATSGSLENIIVGPEDGDHLEIGAQDGWGRISGRNAAGDGSFSLSYALGFPYIDFTKEDTNSKEWAQLNYQNLHFQKTFYDTYDTNELELRDDLIWLHQTRNDYSAGSFTVEFDSNNKIKIMASSYITGGDSVWPEYSYVSSPDDLPKGSVQVMSLLSLKTLFDSASISYIDRLSKLSVLIIRNNSTY